MNLIGWFKKIFTKPQGSVEIQKRLYEVHHDFMPEHKVMRNDIIKEELNSLSLLKQEYERLCSVIRSLEEVATEYANRTLTTIPELPHDFSNKRKTVNIYNPPKLASLPTMTGLKRARIEEELYQLKIKEQEVTKYLGMANDYIGAGDFEKAHEVLEIAKLTINTVESTAIELRLKELSKTLHRKETDAKMLKREKRLEERRKKKKAAEEKYRFLKCVQTKNMHNKTGAMIALRDFSDNGIAYLYHFTSKANLKSIRKHGGLYARTYHSRLGIIVKDDFQPTRQAKPNNAIDFSEYISLSVCKEHYLAREMYDAGIDVCILKISTDVVMYYNTYFTDRDTSNERYKIGKGIHDTSFIDFNAVKDDNLLPNDVGYIKKYAEVLVDSFIPISLIENIDNPIIVK